MCLLVASVLSMWLRRHGMYIALAATFWSRSLASDLWSPLREASIARGLAVMELPCDPASCVVLCTQIHCSCVQASDVEAIVISLQVTSWRSVTVR